MSKNITVTVQDSVFDTLNRRIGKLATTRVPGMNISKSNYVSIAIKEKLLRDGEVLEENKPEPVTANVTANVTAIDVHTGS